MRLRRTFCWDQLACASGERGLNSSLGSHGPRVRDAQWLAVGSGQGQEAVAAAWGRGLFFLLRSEAPRRVSESRTRSIQLPMEVVLALDVSAPSARKEILKCIYFLNYFCFSFNFIS